MIGGGPRYAIMLYNNCKLKNTKVLFLSQSWSNWTNISMADYRLAPGQWETSLQSNAVSHWLGANLESALISFVNQDRTTSHFNSRAVGGPHPHDYANQHVYFSLSTQQVTYMQHLTWHMYPRTRNQRSYNRTDFTKHMKKKEQVKKENKMIWWC